MKYQWVSASGSFWGGKGEGQGSAVAPHSPPATESSELSIHPRSTKLISHQAGVHVTLKHLQARSEIVFAGEPWHPQPWGRACRDVHIGQAGSRGQHWQMPIFVQAVLQHTCTSWGMWFRAVWKSSPEWHFGPMGWAYLPDPCPEAVSPATSPASQHLPSSQCGVNVLPNSQKRFHSPSVLQWQPPRWCATSTPANSISCFWPRGSPSNQRTSHG